MWPWKSKTAILLEEVAFYRAQIAQLQNYLLMTGGVPTGFPTWDAGQTMAKRPGSSDEGPEFEASEGQLTEAARLYTTELEEDIEFQLQEGLIGEVEAARLLKEADAIANDIEVM